MGGTLGKGEKGQPSRLRHEAILGGTLRVRSEQCACNGVRQAPAERTNPTPAPALHDSNMLTIWRVLLCLLDNVPMIC